MGTRSLLARHLVLQVSASWLSWPWALVELTRRALSLTWDSQQAPGMEMDDTKHNHTKSPPNSNLVLCETTHQYETESVSYMSLNIIQPKVL